MNKILNFFRQHKLFLALLLVLMICLTVQSQSHIFHLKMSEFHSTNNTPAEFGKKEAPNKANISFKYRVNNYKTTSASLIELKILNSRNDGINFLNYARELSRFRLVVGGTMLGFRQPIELGKWYDFDIVLYPKWGEVWMDGKLMATGKISKYPATSLDEIALGSYKSSLDNIDFEVKKLRIDVENYNKYLHMLMIVSLCLLVVMGLFAYNGVGLKDMKSVDKMKLAQGVALILLIAFLVFLKKSTLSLSLSGVISYAVTLLLVFYFLKKAGGSKILTGLLSLVFSLFVIVNVIIAGYFWKGQFLSLSSQDMEAVQQSNTAEALGFLITFFTLQELAVFVVLSLLSGLIFYFAIYKNALRISKAISTVFILIIFAVVFAYLAGRTQSYFYPLYKNAEFMLERQRKNEKQREESQAALEGITAKKKEQGETYVLVIGESANRDHMGVYGYFRDTTPFLSSLDHNRLFFTNAYSSYSHTGPSVKELYTTLSQYPSVSSEYMIGLNSIAKKAGFNLYFLSNQMEGLLDETGVMSEYAKYDFSNGYIPDGVLIPHLRKVMGMLDKSANNLIIIHLGGSHAPYKPHLPQGYSTDFLSDPGHLGRVAQDKKFVKDTLNPYDDSIRYTDEILREIDTIVGVSDGGDEVKALLYLSDHGEDVYGRKFHNANLFTYDMIRIPLVLLYSDGYKDRYAKKMVQIGKNKDKVFTADLTFNLMNGLMGIDTPVNDLRYDITKSGYVLNWGNAMVMDEKLLKATEDPRLIVQRNIERLAVRYPGKFAAHFQNNIRDASNSLNLGVRNIELDIMSEDGGLIVAHKAHNPEINRIELDLYLSLLDLSKLDKIWFDLKNLDEQNVDRTLKNLEDMDKKYDLKRRTMLETTAIFDEVCKLRDAGWRVSLYLSARSTGVKSDDVPLKIRAELDVAAEKTAALVKKLHFSEVSFDKRYYPFVKGYLEKYLPKRIVYHTWAGEEKTAINSSEYVNWISREPFINDSRVKTYLFEINNVF